MSATLLQPGQDRPHQAARIDYYYSPLSPFTYLGAPRLFELAARHGVTVVHKPMRMGEIFAATGGLPLPQRSEARRAYRLVELARISRRYGLPLTLHPAHFPCDDTLAAGVILAAQQGGLDTNAVSLALCRAVWVEDRNIADPADLAAALAPLGVDVEALLAAAPEAETQRAACTAEALAAGVFGAPSYVWKGEVFWGQDRLDYLAEAMAAK